MKRFKILLILAVFLGVGIASASFFQDSSQSDFDGTYANVSYNSSGFLQLNSGSVSGNYLSNVFDSGLNSSWLNISFGEGLCYGCELPGNGINETGYRKANVSMSGNFLLAHFNDGVSATSFSDDSGSSNSGSCSGSNCPISASGRFNTGFDFDGSNDYIDFGNPSEFGSLGNKITVEAWVLPQDYCIPGSDFPTIVDKDFSTSFSLYFAATGSCAGDNERGLITADLVTSSGSVNVQGVDSYSQDKWYHVVFVYDGNNAGIYVNDILVGSGSITGNVTTNSKNFLVGEGWSGSSVTYPFAGIIDEVAVYNRALNESEIKSRYLRGITNLNLSVRGCDNVTCSGEIFEDVNESIFQNLSLSSNQYFQYSIDFNSENSSLSPEVYDLSVEYDAQNSAPEVGIVSPVSGNYSNNILNLSFVALDSDGNLNSCWYSLDGGISNVTVSCGGNFSGLVAQQGTNVWRVYANDSLGESASDNVSFFVDSLPPEVSFNIPQNVTYMSLPIEFNVTLNEVGNVWFSLDSGAGNVSMNSGDGLNFIYSQGGLSDGSHLFEVYANDSLGNVNSSESAVFSLNTDNQGPIFSGFVEGVLNGSSYSPGRFYEFNVGVDDASSVDSVGMEWNGINYSAYGNYSFNISDLGVGSYQYYWWANDSFGNFNLSDVFVYDVVKDDGNVDLLLNGVGNNLSLVYGQEVNATAFTSYGTLSLFRNGVNVNGENGINVSLSVGDYNYTAVSSGNENYSGALLSRFISIAKISSEVQLFLNNSRSNITIYEGGSIWLNASVVEGEGNAELYLNGELVNSGNLDVSNLTEFSSPGSYNVTALYPESENYSSSNEEWFVEVLELGNHAPQLIVNSPGNNSNFSTSSVSLVVSVFDSDLDNLSVEFYGDGALLTGSTGIASGTEFNYNWTGLGNGRHNWSVFVDDNLLNVSSDELYFNVNTSVEVPDVNILHPSTSSSYGNVSSVSLNYFVNSRGFSADCKYTLDEGLTNNSIPSCLNTTFSVPSDGEYNISLYAKEGFTGLEGSDKVSFFVRNGKPDVHLLSPGQDNYTSLENITFEYIPSSSGSVSRCEFWNNFIGSFSLGETDFSIIGDTINSFDATNLSEGNYVWAIACLDNFGNYALSGNRSLHIDRTPPNVSISEPSGTYSDNTVPLSFEVNDSSPVSQCSYNLSFTINSQTLVVTVLSGCENTFINVQTPTDYQLTLTADDSAGNSGGGSTNFAVTESSISSGSGGGGGGSGGGVQLGGVAQLTYAGLPGLSLKKGRSAVVSFSALNTGSVFLNSCELVSNGAFSDLISSSQVENLELGQKVVFVFEIAIPQGFDSGTYDMNMDVVCDETTTNIPLQVVVLPSDFSFEFLGTEINGLNFKADYILEDLSGVDQDVDLAYHLENRNGNVILEGKTSVFVPADSNNRYTLEFELPRDVIGEYRLFMDFTTPSDSLSVVKRVVLPSQNGITGLAVSEGNQRTLMVAGGILLGIIILVYVARFLSGKIKGEKISSGKKKRRLIKLNLKE